LLQASKFNSLIFLFFSKNDKSEIFELPIFKISNFSIWDKGVKSLILWQLIKYNCLIFLLFSKNDILEIFL